jgi:Fe-S cluster assembly protein SufD
MNQVRLLEPYCLDIDAIDEPPILKRHRRQAQEALFCQKIPKEIESILSYHYKRPSSQEIEFSSLKEHIQEGCEESYIVFINGFLRLDLSNIKGLSKAVLLPFHQAARSFSPLLDSFHSSHLLSEKDPLLLLQLSAYQEGAFLYIPPNLRYEKPLQILSYIKGSTNLWVAPRCHLTLGHHSSLTLLETPIHVAENKALHTNTLTFDIAEGASLQHSYVDLSKQETTTYHSTCLRAFLKKEASFSSISLTKGPFHRDSKKIVLQEEGASTNIQGIWLGKEEDQLHTIIQVKHIKPLCRSSQLFKGVLSENAVSSFHGTISIDEKASLSEAYETNHNLLIGEKSKASSYPNLEIFNDDVKVHHGVTYGKLDKEALFYMRTRGIDYEKAKKLLIQGFQREILEEIPHSSLKKTACDIAFSFHNKI